MIRIKAYNNDYRHLHDFIANLPATFDTSGEVIYEDRNVVRRIEAPDGTMLNVKRYRVPTGINRFVYSSGLRKPKGERAYRYPAQLLEAGIDTPTPIAYIEERHFGILAYSWFVSLHCPYEHTLKEAGDAKEGTYESLARHFGRFTARLHEKNVMHLDYSPGNILFRVTEEGKHLFSLVDINRMRFGKPVSMREGVANMRRLWGPKRFFILMVEEYARARGEEPAKWVDYALEVRANFWKKFGKKHTIHFKLEL